MNENQTGASISERYRFNQQIVRVLVGNNQELLHCDLTGATQLVAKPEVRILQACQKWATLDDHARQVCKNLGFGVAHLSAVRQQLDKFAESGLIVPHSLLINWCKKGSTTDSTKKIGYFGVLTRNRTQSLKTCLSSYAKFANEERKVTFVVADQSDRDECAHNAAAMQAIKNEFDVAIEHIDVEHAHKRATQLSEISGVAPSLINFALTRTFDAKFAGGANRNLLLLSSVGELLLQADDDSECRVSCPPGAEPGLALSSGIDPAEMWFPTEDEINAMEQNLISEDLFAAHERFLGKSVQQCIRESDGPVDIDGTTPSFFWRLDHEPTKVLATNAGLIGESGRAEGQPIFLIDGERRNRLVVSEEHYRYVQKTQRVLRGVTRPTITEGAVCYGFNLGLDNRENIPPFLPILRGEDSMFTAVFRAATTNGFFAILPSLVYHVGAGAKKRPDMPDPKRVMKLVFCDIITMILQSFSARTLENKTELRLKSIKELLVEISSLEPEDFARLISTIWWQTAQNHINRIETALKLHSNKPEFWSRGILEYLDQYRCNLTNPLAIVAGDLVTLFGESEAFEKQQMMIRMYGELIGAWGSLREAAATIREKEGSFGKRI